MSEYPWNKNNNKFTWLSSLYNPFKCQSHKMVTHTQTICQQIADELFECVWPFGEIGA